MSLNANATSLAVSSSVGTLKGGIVRWEQLKHVVWAAGVLDNTLSVSF